MANLHKEHWSIGKSYTMNKSGWECKVLNYHTGGKVEVEWQDGSRSFASLSNLGKGNVRPPNAPSIVGVGINDMVGTPYCLEKYQKWQSMIKRAYCPHYHKNKKTYKDVEVVKEWHRLSSFLEWAEGWGDVSGLELDKDIKGCGKVYSPDSCIFIPSYINSFFIKSGGRKEFAWKERLRKYEVSASTGAGRKNTYVGVYSTKEEALEAYKIAKWSRLEPLIERYRQESFYREDVEEAIRNNSVWDSAYVV